jgi:hypothetical protein
MMGKEWVSCAKSAICALMVTGLETPLIFAAGALVQHGIGHGHRLPAFQALPVAMAESAEQEPLRAR